MKGNGQAVAHGAASILNAFATGKGAAMLTDNDRRKVEKVLKVPENIRIIILVPPRQTLTGKLDRRRFAPVKRISELAYIEAGNGHIWDALTLNGLAFSAVLGEDPRPAISAIEAGALGAGLSGKGPAVVAVVEERDSKKVRHASQKLEGRTTQSDPNYSRACVET